MKHIVKFLEQKRRQRFNAARKTALAISDFLVKTYHADKIVLIGSLLDEQRFDIHSDIDLCVEGIPTDSFFRAVGESLLLAGPFDVDLIPMEHASERMNKHVIEGEVLYVKA
jgi:predicted nucleotidyltransferase